MPTKARRAKVGQTIFQLAAIEEVGLTTESKMFSFLVAVWSKICPPCARSRRVGRSDLVETHAYVPSLPVLMKQLQAVRHASDLSITAVERSSSTSKGVAVIP